MAMVSSNEVPFITAASIGLCPEPWLRLGGGVTPFHPPGMALAKLGFPPVRHRSGEAVRVGLVLRN